MKGILAILGLVLLFQCDQIEFEEGDNISFNLSQDTLTFDTVFTTIGSATRFIKVYNPSDKFITIDRVTMKEDNPFFFINVNGVSGEVIENIEIAPEDSIYIFVEAVVDPDQDLSESPFIIEQDLLIEAGQNQKEVVVVAWGQNAFYFPIGFGKEFLGQSGRYTCGNGELVLDNSKPWIFYGSVTIDSCAMRIPEGTRIHIHGGIVNGRRDGLLAFGPDGKLIIEGTASNPVTIRGSRLEEKYIGRPAQYAGIYFTPGSNGNSVRHTIIQESDYGFFVDSASSLTIENTEVRATTGPGVWLRHASVEMTNTLVESNGSADFRMTYGGEANIRYCTFSNFQANQQYAILAEDFQTFDDDNDGIDDRIEFNDLKLDVINSIAVADEQNAVIINVLAENGQSEYSFANCILNMSERYLTETNPDFGNHLSNTIITDDIDALFVGGRDNGDYHLDSLSVATGAAQVLPGIDVDLENYPRHPLNPDIGAYENRFK